MLDSRDIVPVARPTAPGLSRWAVVVAVARRGGPRLLEATVIPGALFSVCLVVGGVGWAYGCALAWVYGCVLRRVIQRRAIPTLLILGAIAVTVRTAVAVGSGSTFFYFVQPIIGTVAMGTALLLSVVIGRPLIGSLAGDFWPVTAEMARNPRVTLLFRRLTLLWAGVNLLTAAVTFVLLVSLPLTTFVAVKQLLVLITVLAVAVTIFWGHRTACREGYMPAPPGKRAALGSLAHSRSDSSGQTPVIPA
jgi:hypothetical protein